MKASTQRILIFGGLSVAFAGLGLGFAYLLKKGRFDGLVKSVLEPSVREELSQMHPAVRALFSRFIDRIENETGYIVRLTSSYRSYAKQAELHRADPRNAKPGESYHNYGMAPDINLIKGDVWLRKSSPKQSWIDSGVPKIAAEMGLRWGGDFKGYYDPIHFDAGNLYPISMLKDAARKQFGDDPAKVIGNQVKIF